MSTYHGKSQFAEDQQATVGVHQLYMNNFGEPAPADVQFRSDAVVDDSITLKALIKKIPPHVRINNHREILIWMDALLAEYYIFSEEIIKKDETILELNEEIARLKVLIADDTASPEGKI